MGLNSTSVTRLAKLVVEQAGENGPFLLLCVDVGFLKNFSQVLREKSKEELLTFIRVRLKPTRSASQICILDSFCPTHGRDSNSYLFCKTHSYRARRSAS